MGFDEGAQVRIPQKLAGEYPDLRCYVVEGNCCSPDLKPGDVVVVTKMRDPMPGAHIVYRVPGSVMPNLAVVTADIPPDAYAVRTNEKRYCIAKSWLLGSVVHIV